MARVDPEDDSIERFIVRHYRYDPSRRERRHVVVAAFDSEQEYHACVDRVQAEIKVRRERGEPVEPGEHASGIVHESGYLRRSANGHLLSRAIRHGAAGPWIGGARAALEYVRHPGGASSGLGPCRGVGGRFQDRLLIRQRPDWLAASQQLGEAKTSALAGAA